MLFRLLNKLLIKNTIPKLMDMNFQIFKVWTSKLLPGWITKSYWCIQTVTIKKSTSMWLFMMFLGIRLQWRAALNWASLQLKIINGRSWMKFQTSWLLRPRKQFNRSSKMASLRIYLRLNSRILRITKCSSNIGMLNILLSTISSNAI